ncbi:MAG TPA: hypothetical protein PKL97_07805 [Candidatus Omnitrophota bacterium]|nr:hypothetical protein [Candidatus Omnitrophota bacterium]
MVAKKIGKFLCFLICATASVLFFAAAESEAAGAKQTLPVRDQLAQGHSLVSSQAVPVRDEAVTMRVVQMERAQEEAGLRMQREKCL